MAVPEGRWFEDFRVGERFTSAPRPVRPGDLTAFTALSGDDHPLHAGPDAVLQGPFGLAVAMGLLQSLGLHGSAVLGLLDARWRFVAPVRVGDELSLRMVVVRCRRTRDGRRGVVTRHMALVDGDGRTVQEGTTAALLTARGPGPDPVGRAFGTVAWAEAVLARLGPGFAADLATWDGAIGLRCGADEVHLRIYRGEVVEVSARVPRGPTFVLEADELTWTELVEAPGNDFVRFGMTGRFAVRGDGYEYLRLTAPLNALVDAARLVAAEET